MNDGEMDNTRNEFEHAKYGALQPESYPPGPRGRRRSAFNCGVEWPKTGGADLVVGPSNIFVTEAFRDVFKPGEVRQLYVGACQGLADHSQKVSMPLFKPGSTAPDRIAARIAELRRDHYGAYRRIDGAWIKACGYDGWFASHLHPLMLASPGSPVTVEPRSIKVMLPASMKAVEFDKAFDASVRLGALDYWATTEVARAHCRARGFNADELQLATQYPGWRLAPAREVTIMTIYHGVDRLVAIAEQIIAAHLGLERRRYDA